MRFSEAFQGINQGQIWDTDPCKFEYFGLENVLWIQKFFFMLLFECIFSDPLPNIIRQLNLDPNF